MSKPNYKHSMEFVSCRLNLCPHPVTPNMGHQGGKRFPTKVSKVSMGRSRSRKRISVTCDECGSTNAKEGTFTTKCYECGLIVNHE